MDDKHAVIDIGSNTVRLAIFCGAPPDHRRLVDRKAVCRLADGLDRSATLSPRGAVMAVDAIGGYLADATAAGVRSVQLVATAAVREAEDGPAFAARLEKRFGHPVRILSGEDEARLSALGVLSGIEAPDGLIADLGGGSLELIEAAGGVLRRTASLPLGHVRLGQRAGGDRTALDRIIRTELERVPWIAATAGKRIWLAGGAWRKLARRHIAKYVGAAPVQGYTLPADAVKRFTDALAAVRSCGVGPPDTVAIAARLIACLTELARPDAVEFSARGLCDGCYLTCRAEAVARRAV